MSYVEGGDKSRALSPAQRAWITRRARAAADGQVYAPAPRASSKRNAALEAFELEASQAMPDWHAVALKLRAALEPASSPAGIAVTRQTPELLAIAAPQLADYPVTWRQVDLGPVIVCSFADGEIVRMSFATAKGKPLNIARGVRVAIAAYRFRIARRRFGSSRLLAASGWIDVPPIASCAVTLDNHARQVKFDAELVTTVSAQWRSAIADAEIPLAIEDHTKETP